MILSSFWGSQAMYMVILWSVVAIVMLILEAESAELVSIWFALGAVGGIISAILQAPIMWQFVVFASVSLVFVLATRPIVVKFTKNTEVRTNAETMLDRIVEVVKEIPVNGRGEVMVDFRGWTAITTNNQSFAVGEKVVIKAIEGNKLVVESIEEIEIK